MKIISKWRTLIVDGKDCGNDMYFTYKLPNPQESEWFNNWYVGGDPKRDDRITLKEVDEESIMYGKKFNPVRIGILDGYMKYDMKAQIHSIDDSQYGIWWNNQSYEMLSDIRNTLMEWIDSKPILNGEEFLNYCVFLGADPNSKDYN